MNRRRLAVLAGAASLAALSLWYGQRQVVYSQSSAVQPVDDSVVSLRVQFGVTDEQPRKWDGKLSVSGGELVALRNWRPRPGDQVETSSWKLETRRGPNFVRRPWEADALVEPTRYMNVPGIIVDVKTTGATNIEFQTANGSFRVQPASLRAGQPATLLNGAVLVDRTATAQTLSEPGYENDFASLVAMPGGGLWAAWVGYKSHATEVFVRRFDGRVWGASMKATAKPGDIFLAKAGRDRGGNLWVVWSEQAGGNFDLYARRYDGRGWSSVERLSSAPQPDVYHNVATDSNGNLWVVWQGFREGTSDIFARRYDGRSWGAEERVSTSAANDWEPVIATDRTGKVYVGWDTYDQGNYDVVVRSWNGSGWGDVMPLATTPKFEAHVALACDDQNRLWAAWNESGMQWGKDTGFLVKKEGTALYRSRWVATAVRAGGQWMQPAAEFDQSLPEDMRAFNDHPALVADGKGRVWLFFRHRLTRIRDVPSDTPAHRAAWEIYATTFDGGRWTTPLQLPFSGYRQDVRAGFAADANGNVYAAWPMDNRDYEAFLYRHADVYAGRLPRPAASAAAPKLVPRHVPNLRPLSVIHPNEGEDLKRIRDYVIDSGGKQYRIYRGDTHRHTEFSMDGNNDGTLQETYRYSIDAASLDFLGVSEHNGLGGPDNEYINWLMQQYADVLMLADRFTPLYAYERSLGYPNGHRNVIFARRGNPTLPIPPQEQKAQTGAQMLYQYLKKNSGIAISHTSASNMGTDWRDNDPEVEPLVEIYQGDRVSAEYEGAPKAAHAGSPASAPGGFRPAGYVWNAWAKGYKLGVQASSDHLSTHISYACTLATDFTREGLLNAMRARHSYGATDNIVLDYRLQTGGKEHLQGDIVQAPGEIKLWLKILGTNPIRQIDIVRNNKFLHTRHPLQKEQQFTFVDASPLPGESYYYVRVIQVDDQMAWSSPIWVKR